MFNLPQQPQSIGDVLSNGFRLYCVGFKKIIVLLLVSSFFATLPEVLADFLEIDIIDVTSDTIRWTPSHFLIIILYILSMLVSFVIYSAIAIQFWGIIHSNTPSIKASLKRGLVCLAPILFASILYGLAVMFGLVLLIVPGIMLSIYLLFYGYFILFEHDGIIASLKHSYQLVRGHWWETAIIQTVISIIMMVVFVVLFVVFIFVDPTIMDFSEEGTHELTGVTLLLSLLLYITLDLSVSLITAIVLVLFYDLKMRKTDDGLQPSLEKLS